MLQSASGPGAFDSGREVQSAEADKLGESLERSQEAVVEEQVFKLFRRAKQVWAEAASRVHPDLKPGGFRVLSKIATDGPSNPGAIAEELDLDKAVVSRQAKLLMELGLIQSQPDPADGRGRLLAATPEACEVVVRTKRESMGWLRRSLGSLEASEVEQLAELLDRVLQANQIER